ncbi:DUF2183 domain-containing protein [Tessaracoccus sp. SD287]|nr:DUF2183 domain-containing protein [Tessaracoccus sp. SD287]
MTDRPFVGARLDEHFSRWLGARLRRRRSWVEHIVAYAGYGSSDQLRILGRVILQPATPKSDLMRVADDFMRRRGWRNFASIPIGRATVKITIGEDTIDVQADRSGYIDVRVRNTSLGPGWHEVTLKTEESRATQAPVQVVGADQEFGLISDIDDTVISTSLPRILIAVWNSLMVTEQARQSVPGMARMYHQVLAEHPGAPTIYISTGAWNTYPFLRRFLKRHGYPQGTMLLTDWGPTNTGWFRSGPDHKRRSLHELARDLPHVKWLLVGDDGQHDPMLYREFADLQPDHVRAIAIRQLTMAQQVLAHGTTTVLGDPNHVHYTPHTVPEVRGADGDELAPKVRAMLGEPLTDGRPTG